MKLTLLTLALLTSAASAVLHAATSVSGVVADQTWTAAKSPYVLTGDVLVGNLKIEPGVQIRAQGNYVFEVPGYLEAKGTADNPIVFTTSSASGWKGIFFNQCAAGSTLVHCRVEKSVASGIRITQCSPSLTDCTIEGNTNTAAGGGGIRIISGAGDIRLTRCIIQGNKAVGSQSENYLLGGGLLACMTNGNLFLEGSTVSHNGPLSPGTSGYGGGVAATLKNGRLSVHGSLISGNTTSASYHGGGVALLGPGELASTVISGNTISSGYGSGLYLTDNATLHSCEIVANTGREAVYGYYSGYDAISNRLELVNCVVANNTGSGVRGYGGSRDSLEILNCTIVANSNHGISGEGTQTGDAIGLRVRNSIVYYNQPQIYSMYAQGTTLAYNNIQGGATSNGNLNVVPLYDPETFRLVTGSPCIDKGDPDPTYSDFCFPPSRGTARNDMGAFGGPGACCWEGPCDVPVIRAQPQSVATCVGKPAAFSVGAIGSGALSYQWFYHELSPTNPPVAIADATGPTLTFDYVELTHAGYYSVVVSSPGGAVTSEPAALVVNELCVGIAMYAGLTVEGQPGTTFVISFTTDLESGNWTPLATNKLTSASWFFVDRESPGQPRRYYRATVRQ